ncbi:MAG: sigma-54-dependent Fis family transcriptional regulator [bacterium]|nr:MAG: sigma-54-dependent Fis family transcriptional regulator [bacterium]
MDRILVVDDSRNVCTVLSDLLEREGYQVQVAHSYDQALDYIEGDDLSVVITDLKMPGRSGMDLLAYSRNRRPEVPVIMITAFGNIEAAVAAMKSGAFDFITKPIDDDELLNAVSRAITESEVNREIVSGFFEEDGSFSVDFIGTTPAVQEILQTVKKIGPTESTVLITGETGVGKELIARALHLAGGRRGRPFVKVHCAAIPENLVESELFGYEKGAFTGAVSSKPGRFEIAHGGTLFLDEVGEIPPHIQVKLLTVLQDTAFERVGGVKTINIDVRIIAATNKDLRSAVASGEFRSDLYYRLNVVPIHIPPLRDRKDDIIQQSEYFLMKFSAKHGRKYPEIPTDIMTAFFNYDWPGNVRELENVIERLVLMSEGPTLESTFLPQEISGPESVQETAGLRDVVGGVSRATERQMIMDALGKTGQNRTRAADLLGISRRTLQKKIKEYGL